MFGLNNPFLGKIQERVDKLSAEYIAKKRAEKMAKKKKATKK